MQPTLAELENRFANALQRQDVAAAHEAAADLRYRYPSSEKGWVYGSMVSLMAGDPATGRVLVAEYLAANPRRSARCCSGRMRTSPWPPRGRINLRRGRSRGGAARNPQRSTLSGSF
jgi:hypothetical protein